MLALALAALSTLFTLFLWRLWKFTLRPWLYPTEPLELPYWLPCGHRELTDTGADADNLTDIGTAIPSHRPMLTNSQPSRSHNQFLERLP